MTTFDFAIEISAVRVWILSAPILTPRRNAFGRQKNRSSLLVELSLSDGGTGWGEAFCSWPEFANLHRGRIIEEVIRPLIIGEEFENPQLLLDFLKVRTGSMMCQSGEPGPFLSAIASIEIAAWDAIGHRAGVPLWCLLSEGDKRQVHVYASGITSDNMHDLVPPLRDTGWRAFKLKLGFGRERDEKALDDLRALVGREAAIMVDVNQAWSLETAGEAFQWLKEHRVLWIEEPISAASEIDNWKQLAQHTPCFLAAGENVFSNDGIMALADAGVAVLQPDPTKYGGVSDSLALARMIGSRANLFCSHYFGGSVGLAATASIALAGCVKFLEVDVTENPLRTTLGRDQKSPIEIEDGYLVPPTKPGLGFRPDEERLVLASVPLA